jgi:hypothetical protein
MKYKDWSDFKAHPSGLAALMARPKNATDLTVSQANRYAKLIIKEDRTDKENETLEVLARKRDRFLDPPLSETAKKYLISRYSKEKYNKRRAVAGIMLPRLAKGAGLEDEALKMLSKFHKIDYSRPEEYISNDFLIGKCDILCEEHKKIVEMKISWSADTFFPYLHTGLSPTVWLQTQGYLELYDLDIAQVCYVLVNTPQHLIDQEVATTFKRYTFGEINREQYDEKMGKIEGFYNYDNIPLRRRIITFNVQRSPEIIASVRRKVELAREWLAEFEVLHMNSKNIVTLSEKYLAIPKEGDIEPDPADACEGDAG